MKLKTFASNETRTHDVVVKESCFNHFTTKHSLSASQYINKLKNWRLFSIYFEYLNYHRPRWYQLVNISLFLKVNLRLNSQVIIGYKGKNKLLPRAHGQISDFIPKKCKILKFRQNVWCILFLIKNNPYSQNLRRLHFAWAEIFAKTFVKYLLGKVPHKMENLQNFYHDWNQHKKLSSGFLIPSHLICNSRDIGHVLFPEGFLRMFFANISAHAKCRRRKFWLVIFDEK